MGNEQAASYYSRVSLKEQSVSGVCHVLSLLESFLFPWLRVSVSMPLSTLLATLGRPGFAKQEEASLLLSCTFALEAQRKYPRKG